MAIEAGAIPLLLSAMRRLHADAKMQTNGCWVLSRLVEGSGPAADARRQAAIDAGAMSLVSAALREHEDHHGIQGAVSRLLARLLGLRTDRDAWQATRAWLGFRGSPVALTLTLPPAPMLTLLTFDYLSGHARG